MGRCYFHGSTVQFRILEKNHFPTCFLYMGQCPAISGLWGYNFITIKIARCTIQHIFATVLLFTFKFRTLVPTPFLCVKIDFCDLQIFRVVDTTIANPAVYMHVCTCMCVHACVYMQVCTCMCVHVCVYMYVCTCMCVHVCTLSLRLSRTQTQIFTAAASWQQVGGAEDL